MEPAIGTLAEVYSNVLDSVPYNSISPVFSVAQRTHNLVFGDNCIGQAEKVKLDLEQRGVQDTFYLRDNRHHVTIAGSGDAIFLLDPYLMHKAPINLTEILDKDGKHAEFEAYPTVLDASGNPKPGYVGIEFNEDGRGFKLVKGRFSPNTATYRRSEFNLSLDNPQPERTAPDDIEIACHPEQTTLSIRALDTKLAGVAHLVYPVHATHGKGPIREDAMYVKLNNGKRIPYLEQEEFLGATVSIARQLGCDPNELLGFILTGATLYEQFAPDEIDFVSFNPTNQ